MIRKASIADVKAVHKLLNTYARDGLMLDGSEAAVAVDAADGVIALKLAHKHWGPKKIRVLYGRRHHEVPSESSFKRVLERAGLTDRKVSVEELFAASTRDMAKV